MKRDQLSIFLGLFAGVHLLLVGLSNVFDYASNFAFVQHVSSMDTLFSGESNRWRAVNTPILQHALYVTIILLELVAGALLGVGVFSAWVGRAGALRWMRLGYTFALVLWFGAFLVVGGEWFLMWQSEKWNAQEDAFLLSILYLLLVLQLDHAEKNKHD